MDALQVGGVEGAVARGASEVGDVEVEGRGAGEAVGEVAVLSRRTVLDNRLVVVEHYIVEHGFVAGQSGVVAGHNIGEIDRNPQNRPFYAGVSKVIVVLVGRTLHAGVGGQVEVGKHRRTVDAGLAVEERSRGVATGGVG